MLYTILLAAVVTAADDSARFQRYQRWAAEGRIDLCAEAIIQCRSDKLAERMADLLLPLRKWPFLHPENARFPKIEHIGPVFHQRRGSTLKHDHYKGESVFVPLSVFVPIPDDPGGRTGLVLVRADKCAVQETTRGGYFVAVRDSVTEKFRGGLDNFPGEWWSSVVIVGNSASVSRVNRSFIVCDGDLKLTSIETNESVIIANGNIDCPCSVNKTKFYAAGKVTIPKGRMNTGEVREDGKDMPVKFLDLGRDLGLRLTDKLALEADWRGLRKGDTVTKIDGAAVDSVPSLRKQLRRGVVRGAAMLEVRRGNETVAQTIRLDLEPAKR
jgi:hypothetical protein